MYDRSSRYRLYDELCRLTYGASPRWYYATSRCYRWCEVARGSRLNYGSISDEYKIIYNIYNEFYYKSKLRNTKVENTNSKSLVIKYENSMEESNQVSIDTPKLDSIYTPNIEASIDTHRNESTNLPKNSTKSTKSKKSKGNVDSEIKPVSQISPDEELTPDDFDEINIGDEFLEPSVFIHTDDEDKDEYKVKDNKPKLNPDCNKEVNVLKYDELNPYNSSIPDQDGNFPDIKKTELSKSRLIYK